MNKHLPHRATALIYGVASLFVIAVLAAAAAMMWQTRQKAIADSESQAARFVGGSEAALNRGLLSVDMLLAGLGQLAQMSDAASVAADLARPEAVQLMDGVVRQNLLVRYMAFLSPGGRVITSSDRRGAKLAVQLPDGFLQQVLAQPVSTLAVSTPSISLSSSQKVLYFARVLRLVDGSKAVALAEVQLSLLTTILTQGADIRGMEVTLERDGGEMLASKPPRDDLSGRTIAPALREQASDGHPVRMAARLSGEPAIVVARPTLHRNLLIVASIPLRFALQGWRRDSAFILGAALVFTLMILAVSVFTHLQLRRQWRSRAELLRSKATLDQALESMMDGFVLLDPHDRVLTWNRRFVDLFPWARALIEPLLPFDRIALRMIAQHSAERPAPGEPGGARLQLQGPIEGEQEVVFPDGQVILSIRSRTPDGGSVCVYRDVTEKKRQTADIVEGKAQLQATLDALPDVLLEVGLDGLCRRFHLPRNEVPGIDVQDPVGKKVPELLPGDAAVEVMAALHDAYVSGFSKGRQFERRAAGGTTWFEISVSRKSIGQGPDTRFIVILRNITDNKLAAREIEHLAFYDGLTGLPNRRLLLHRLQAAIDSNHRRSRRGALLFLDLDHFKTLNDASGHAIGDLLLKQVAARLQAGLREGDTVARLGGDEFVVLLENLGDEPDSATMQAATVADALLAELDLPYQLTAARQFHSTCSIGVVVFRGQQHSLEDLLKQADIATYYAKTAGGNTVRFFEAAMQATITARATLESELRTALAADQFVLHYQSQVTSEGRIVGAEVLIRWQHPARGLVPPAGFIDLAEDTGLIVPIGLWVLEAACAQLERWSHQPARRDLQLAVNVSARQFREDDFVLQVSEVLERTGADPTRLKLELTESLLQDKVAEMIGKMKALAEIGIHFSMDDFGTGYSSLSYMTQLPLDQIKVDKFFVHSIGIHPKVELIIQTIIGMARNLELEIVAEGIETPEQLAFLKKHGCMLYQGYLFGKPVPLQAFESHLDLETVD
ncbi:bifunctional diguanylate cyclase/phosphodiesterase [Variovorax sp. PBL-E5]|uniref:bifunctional diguanylate cyclase/phosphodiesterase n=1 Tax=Variovorax sp. PBL-E5 TaxID=434014 RepID=UPI001319193A|nr:EAL domain-containing protein [Variovorax sp. PBL-E5]VTU25525.1 Cyclic di-GMP phosphodiesterase Gmr [Variovorax sp. PBL-E5]